MWLHFSLHSHCQGMNLFLINFWFLLVSLFLSYLVLYKFCFVLHLLVWSKILMRFGVARNWLLLVLILLRKHRMFQMLVGICPLLSSILFFKMLVSCDFLSEFFVTCFTFWFAFVLWATFILVCNNLFSKFDCVVLLWKGLNGNDNDALGDFVYVLREACR